MTPQSWILGWNATFRDRVRWLSGQLDAINEKVGTAAFQIDPPQGGWYSALRIHPGLFDSRIQSSVDAMAVFLHYGGHHRDSGIAALPGELAGYQVTTQSPEFVLRLNLAVSRDELARCVARLREMAMLLTSDQRQQVIATALDRAAHVLPAHGDIAASPLIGWRAAPRNCPTPPLPFPNI